MPNATPCPITKQKNTNYFTKTISYMKCWSSELATTNYTHLFGLMYQWGFYLTPFDHMCLFSLVSILTSGVPIIFTANFRSSLMERGALFLKPLHAVNGYFSDQTMNQHKF